MCCKRPQYLPETGRCQVQKPVQTFRAQSKCQQRNTVIARASGWSDVIVWRARFQYSGFLIVTKNCSCWPSQHVNITAMSALYTGIGVHTTGGLYIYQYSSEACRSEMHYTYSNLHILHYTNSNLHILHYTNSNPHILHYTNSNLHILHYTNSNLHILHCTHFTHKRLTNLKIFTVYSNESTNQMQHCCWSWSGRSARPRPTAMLPPRSNGKTRGCYSSYWAPDDGHEDARNMLGCI